MVSSYLQNKRWRLTHPEKRHAQKKRNYAQTQGEKITRRKWTQHEDAQILVEGEMRPSDAMLAKTLGRTVQAIQLRRSKLLKPITADSS